MTWLLAVLILSAPAQPVPDLTVCEDDDYPDCAMPAYCGQSDTDVLSACPWLDETPKEG